MDEQLSTEPKVDNGRSGTLLLGKARRPTSALNDPVWRFALIIAGGTFLSFLVQRIFSPTNGFGLWLLAIFAGLGWFAAVRLLLLDSWHPRIWSGALVLAVLAVSWGGDTGLALGIVVIVLFLLFRRYRPLRHLSSARRARLFLMSLFCFFLVSIGVDLPDDVSGIAGYGRNLAAWSIWGLRLFWLSALIQLVLRARLHFMRLRPKLAVSAALIAGVPLLLMISFGLVALYLAIGGYTTNRTRAVLDDWATLVNEQPDAGTTIFGTGFYREKGEAAVVDEPYWVDQFLDALDSTQTGSDRWAPSDTTAYFELGEELWLVRLREFDRPNAKMWAFPVNAVAIGRLSELMHGEVRLVLTEFDAEAALGDDDSGIAISPEDLVQGRFSADPADSTRKGLFQRRIYFGGSFLDTVILDDDQFETSQTLLTLSTRLADLGGEFVSEDNEMMLAITALLGFVAFLFLIVEVFALFFGLRIATGITSAMGVLHRGTDELTKGNLDVRIDVPNEDEFGDLADSFNEMTKAVKRGQEELLERERLERELAMARDIQQRLLPFAIPQLIGFEIASISEPSRQVGGDYYDFLHLAEGELGVAVGDVSGKGIPAALLMSNLQASLKGQLLHPSCVSDVVSNVNDLLVGSTAVNMFATFFYGVLHGERGTFTATNAGHDPPILCRADGQVERISTGGLLLGVLEGQSYQETTVSLDDDDVMVLYTDGITEAMGPLLALPPGAGESGTEKGRSGQAGADRDADDEEEEEDVNLFEEERLLDVIRENRHRSAEGIKQAILDAVARHTSGIPQSDDITLVVIKRVSKS